MTWGLYTQSHWQGSGPGQLIATGPQELCEAAENALSSCSFCGYSRRAGSYNVGTCYAVRPVRYRRSGVPAIPPEAADWERHDWHAWLDDQRIDCD